MRFLHPSSLLLAGALCIFQAFGANASPSEAARHTAPVRIADFLYEMTCLRPTPIPMKMEAIPGLCSSVRNGNFHARNLDFVYSDFPQFVVHTPAGKGRHASVAVCITHTPQTAFEKGEVDEKTFDEIPHMVVDGINDRGVAMNINVIYAADTAPVTGTNPGKPNLPSAFVLRYLLDRADSAAHAVQLLSEVNLLGAPSTYGFHYMISDALETYVIEIVDNKVVAVKQNIMTNFFNSMLPAFNKHALGIERYLILAANYAQGSTKKGICDLMQKVRYSLYTKPGFQPMWYSEFYEGQYDISTPNESLKEEIAKHNEAVANARREDRNPAVWITVNTSVYDLAKRQLHLHVQEDYEHHYEFGLKQKKR